MNRNKLTKHEPGSIKEVLTIFLPLMLLLLSTSIMILVDRMILARYNVDTMNAVGTAANAMSAFTCAFIATASIAEIFVGQYNGLNQPKKLAIPVWQMLWFALFSSVVFIPLAFWSGHWFLPDSIYNEAFPFYFLLVLIGPVFTAVSALSAFFIGQGKTFFVTIAAILSNAINIILDFILIFGVEGYIEPMGSKGAGLATTFAQLFFLGLLASVFFSKKNITNHHTTNFSFNKKVFLECIKIGAPSTLSSLILLSGWGFITIYISYAYFELLTVYTLGIAIFLFFLFYTDSLSKATSTIISNAIGSGELKIIDRTLKSATIIHIFFLILILIPTWIFPELIILGYFGENNQLSIYDSEQAILTLKSLALLFLLEGFVGIFSGIFIAGGDTKYIMLSNTIATWICTVLPCYICLKYFNISVAQIFFFIFPLYGISMIIMYINRYKNNKWLQYRVNKDD
jgi:MATE family multidrug resistance protein